MIKIKTSFSNFWVTRSGGKDHFTFASGYSKNKKERKKKNWKGSKVTAEPVKQR